MGGAHGTITSFLCDCKDTHCSILFPSLKLPGSNVASPFTELEARRMMAAVSFMLVKLLAFGVESNNL